MSSTTVNYLKENVTRRKTIKTFQKHETEEHKKSLFQKKTFDTIEKGKKHVQASSLLRLRKQKYRVFVDL